MDIAEDTIDNLHEHAQVSIAFRVERMLEISTIDGGLGGLRLTPKVVAQPWVKDYDAVKGEGPTRWAKRFDVSNWGLISAHDRGERVGGAVVAFDTAGVHMLEGRTDLAALWDIRLQPEYRSSGTGSLLFGAAEDWARARGCHVLKVETQNINLPACAFYRRMGCTLASIDCLAYPDLPDETQLIWIKHI